MQTQPAHPVSPKRPATNYSLRLLLLLVIVVFIAVAAAIRNRNQQVIDHVPAADQDQSVEDEAPTHGSAVSATTSEVPDVVGSCHTGVVFSIGSSSPYSQTEKIWIFDQTETPLMAKIGPDLIARLKQSGLFSEVAYFPGSSMPPPGRACPDLFMFLDLRSYTESAEVTATVHASLQSHALHPNSVGSPSLMREFADIDFQLEVNYTGPRTRQPDNAAASVAGELAELVEQAMEKVHEDYPSLSDTPEALLPDWPPPPRFAFLRKLQPRPVINTHGPLRATDALWDLEVPPKRVVEALTVIHDELIQRDWDVKIYSVEPTQEAQLYAQKDDAVLTAFRPRTAVDSFISSTNSTASDEDVRLAIR